MPLAWVALMIAAALLLLLLLTNIRTGIGVVNEIEILFDSVELLFGTIDDVADEGHSRG